MPCCEPLKRPQSRPSLNSPSPPRRGSFLAAHGRPRLPELKRPFLNEQVALNGKVCRFQQQTAPVSAARAAAHHHIHIFLLAGQPGGLAIFPARGRLPAVVGINLPVQLSGAVPASRTLQNDTYP